jgi:hypothetical protein
MAYTPQLNPQPLGNVTVTTPGTPVQITLALQSTAAGSGNVVNAATDKVLVNKISLIASPITHTGAGNTGNVYFGSRTMNRSTLSGVIGIIAPTGSFSITTNVNLNAYDANALYIDADNAGDGVYGSLDTI